MGEIQIDFYVTRDNHCPVEEFIKSLSKKMYAKVLRTIDLLEANGSELREPHSKAIGDGIFELRIRQGSDISRVFYFFFIGNMAILTNGYIKKTFKTPASEIALAKKYKADYERRFLK